MRLSLANKDKHGPSKHERMALELDRLSAARCDPSILAEIKASFATFDREQEQAKEKEREFEEAHPDRFHYHDQHGDHSISAEQARAIFKLWAAGLKVTDDNIDKSAERSIAILDDLPVKQLQSAPFRD